MPGDHPPRAREGQGVLSGQAAGGTLVPALPRLADAPPPARC